MNLCVFLIYFVYAEINVNVDLHELIICTTTHCMFMTDLTSLLTNYFKDASVECQKSCEEMRNSENRSSCRTALVPVSICLSTWRASLLLWDLSLSPGSCWWHHKVQPGNKRHLNLQPYGCVYNDQDSYEKAISLGWIACWVNKCKQLT